jgi:hypothetical protein
MYLLVIAAVVFSAVIGLVLKFVFDRMDTERKITWIEYGIVMAIISFIAAPGSVWVGWQAAKQNQITFYEYWNGWEMHASREDTRCTRDGSCHWEYDCDPYQVSYSCNCDDKGDNCQTCYRTEYHSCPYVDHEIAYYVETSIGNYVIGEHRFPIDPQEHRWRSGHYIPEGVIENAGVGDPPFWTEAKKRLDAGTPGPATARKPYPNFILASEQSILKQYSGDIEDFIKKGLLPTFQETVYDFYFSRKVYCVGFRPDQLEDWVKKLDYFNAALGSGLQGDLHIVLVKSKIVEQNPDAYTLSLKAYWQDVKRLGKGAMSKNAIVVVCLTDGQKITWARSFTGMPLGNEQMLTAIDSRLRGADLNPGVVIGDVRAKNNSALEKEGRGAGILQSIVFGLSDRSTKFRRVSMSAKDKWDMGSGFLYLLSEIKPSPTQEILIFIGTFLFCSLGWLVAIFVGPENNFRSGRRFGRF